MTSLREQLARKRAHSTSLTFPLGEAGERAKAEMEAAEQAHLLAQISTKGAPQAIEAAIKRAESKLKRARATYAKPENSMTIRFRGLSDEERDALMSAHPATDEQRAREQADGVAEEERSQVNRTTFTPAALAIAAIDSDLTEDEWATELSSDRWTAGERLALFRAIFTATHAEPAPGVGKGFATIR